MRGFFNAMIAKSDFARGRGGIASSHAQGYNHVMAEYTKEKTPEEEIRELEKKLEAKKQELAEKGMAAAPEKEVFREVLKTHIEEARVSPREAAPPLAGGTPTGGTQPQKTDDRQKEERARKLAALIEFALAKTIRGAVGAAESESPYLLDELHDHLVDEYYEKLVALRKIDTQ